MNSLTGLVPVTKSLVHAYLDKEITIVRKGPCGILFNPAKKTYTFYIKTYLKDFEKTVDDYIEELHNNAMAVKNMEKAFRNKVSLT